MGVDGADDGQEGERDQVSSEIEVVLAGSGSDTIEDEWDIPNTFDGGPGNDVLLAHRATDTMVGGDGIDTLSYAPFDGRDRIYFKVEIDVLEGKAVSLEPGFVQMTTTFSGIERFIGSDQSDVLRGGLFGDFLDGFSGDDLILGRPGGDTMLGSAGNDELRGEEGDDRLDGGDDKDVLKGDTGADTLIGGAGVDDFQGGEPDPPDEETDEALDWDSSKEPTCSSTIQCP
jgi:Ca2+-binding RTX toxin-like protein